MRIPCHFSPVGPTTKRGDVSSFFNMGSADLIAVPKIPCPVCRLTPLNVTQLF